jgi:hypothetical protein
MARTDPVGILHLAGVSRNSAPTLHAAKDRRSRNNHNSLPLRARRIQSPVYPQLDLPLYFRRAALLRPDRCDRWHHSDGAVFGLLLHLLYKVSHFTSPNERLDTVC